MIARMCQWPDSSPTTARSKEIGAHGACTAAMAKIVRVERWFTSLEDLEVIRRFAGDDLTKARYYGFDSDFPARAGARGDAF